MESRLPNARDRLRQRLTTRTAAVVGLVGLLLVIVVLSAINSPSGPPNGASSPTPLVAVPTLSPSVLPGPTHPASPTGQSPPPSNPATAAPTSPAPPPPPNPTMPPGPDYLLMSRAEFFALPTSGTPWDELVKVADEELGEADLTDRNSRHAVRTLAVAMVAARAQDEAHRERARQAILDAIGTEQEGRESSILALGRQLAAYVLAADFVELADADDALFRDWLTEIRTRELGGHGRWTQLIATHEDSTNNWGAFAGASRIAASLYLEDTADVEQAARVLRGFLGDRSAWSRWQEIDRADASWACDTRAFTPINLPCTRDGINLDGAIAADISRGGRLRWPPRRDGILYTNESLQGLALQAELLRMAGYDPWQWSDRALERAALFLQRAEGWNETSVSFHVAWLFNARYPLDLPTEPAGYGRVFGFTDWLYGEQ